MGATFQQYRCFHDGYDRRFSVLVITLAALLLTGSPTSPVVPGASAAGGHVYEIDIVEELPPRSLIGTVRTHPDVAELLNGTGGSSLRFGFRYPNSAHASLFSIDDRSGNMTTSRRIDREQLCPSSASTCHLSLDITVTPKRFFRIIRVRVNVADINDNSPTFGDTRVRVDVRENAAPGLVISLPSAEDADSGEFGVRRYEITPLPVSSVDYPFRLTVRHSSSPSSDDDGGDGGGEASTEVFLTVTGRLDRETRPSYQFRLTAYDGGQPTPRTGSVDVTVVVVDANDNNPRFDVSSYEADVSENQPIGTTIVRVHASDPDDGLNGEIVYKIADQSPTKASGSGSSSSSSSASATGGDADVSGPFAINSRTGEVYVSGLLDAEQHAGYQLTVVAADRGVGSLPAYARVTIRVTDANDNQPTIVVNSMTKSGRVEVVENAAAGVFIAFVSARDADSGKSGAVDCTLTAGNNRFRLEPVAGGGSSGGGEYKLMTTTTFDREVADRHYVTLRCADNGSPPLSSTAEVEIDVIDENDNAPTFDAGPMHSVAMLEGNYVGVVVVAMNTSDPDAGPNGRVTYRMQPEEGTPEGAADIDAQSGVVYATTSFDYETRREYRYRVTVVDGGAKPLSGTSALAIRIVDVNDERPQFERQTYHFTTTENRPAGTLVGTVRASDADITPSFNRIVYSIVQGHGSFELDPMTGALTTARRLDREEAAVYELTVRASNDPAPPGGGTGASFSSSSLQSTATVVVRVEDENDNAPTIRFPTPSDRLVVDVPVSAPVGTLLTRIEATDPDDGPNGVLAFALANGNEDGLFAIDRDTGTLTTARRLGQLGPDGTPLSSVADPMRSYRLVVTVRDRGTPERLAVADLTIAVNCSAAAAKMYVDRSHPSTSGASRLGAVDADPIDDIQVESSDAPSTPPSSSLVGALFFNSSHRVVVLATVISVALFLIIVIVAAVGITVVVCRWRRRRRRKLTDRRRDEWLRQQASTACSDAGCSCAERRSTASNRSCVGANRVLHHHDSASLAGSSIATSSMRGGGRMTVLVPQSTSTSLSRAGPWTAVIDTGSGTERDDDSENDDVPLSSGLMTSSSSSHHACRCDGDRTQSVGLLGGLNEKSSAIDCVQLAPLSTSSQRATPDVLRQAAAAAGDPAAGNCSGMPPIGASSASAATRAGQRTPRTSAGRNHHHHYHHQRSGGAHRRAGKSPSGSLGPGYRPNSASSASPCGGGNSSVSAAARRQRGGHRHPVKSDVELSDRNADGDSESEYSGSTTYRDSGMDHSEDSDNLVPPPPLPPSASTTAAVTVIAQPPPPPPRVVS